MSALGPNPYFPIMSRRSTRQNVIIRSVKLAMMLEHQQQALRNHDQTIQRLAERGGLDPAEAIAVLLDRKYEYESEGAALLKLDAFVDEWEAAERKRKSGPPKIASGVRLPDFVTFTGLDASTDYARAAEIATRYPVEWAVLVSNARTAVGDKRFPGLAAIQQQACELPSLAVHICGELAERVTSIGAAQVSPDLAALLERAQRVQVNHKSTAYSKFVASWASFYGCRGIAQWRSATSFPLNRHCDWLFDRSGGTGTVPTEVPQHHGIYLVGYAGGIAPDNVQLAVESIAAKGPYWLDMETGVRTDDWLDLDKCQAVCEAIWGKR